MSLQVYLKREDIPKGENVIYDNNGYFTVTTLTDEHFTHLVLREVDQAFRVGPDCFKGRNHELVGITSKDNLSTGAKTLLNIKQHPSKIIFVGSCGHNALRLLPELTEGRILWEIPYAGYTGDGACDILCDGKHFTDFYEFMEYGMERTGG